MNSIRTVDETPYQMQSECIKGMTPAFGFIAGALFPISMFTFINADFCWNE